MAGILSLGNINIEKTFSRLGDYLKTSNFWISLAILVVAIILWQVLKKVHKTYVRNNGGNVSTAAHVLIDVGRFVFIFIVIIALMQLNGVNVTGLITSLGIVSVIVGLALQDFLKDIIMGIHMLTDKFFAVGDVVRYQTVGGQIVEGEVISFNVRTTKLRLVQYEEVLTISNRNISEIMVMSDIFDLDIDIPYHVDPTLVHTVMQKMAESIAKIEGISEAMYKGTESFNESSVTYRLRYWTSPKSSRFDLRRKANGIVQTGLREAGIPFAFNHLDVELVTTQTMEKRSLSGK